MWRLLIVASALSAAIQKAKRPAESSEFWGQFRAVLRGEQPRIFQPGSGNGSAPDSASPRIHLGLLAECCMVLYYKCHRLLAPIGLVALCATETFRAVRVFSLLDAPSFWLQVYLLCRVAALLLFTGGSLVGLSSRLAALGFNLPRARVVFPLLGTAIGVAVTCSSLSLTLGEGLSPGGLLGLFVGPEMAVLSAHPVGPGGAVILSSIFFSFWAGGGLGLRVRVRSLHTVVPCPLGSWGENGTCRGYRGPPSYSGASHPWYS